MFLAFLLLFPRHPHQTGLLPTGPRGAPSATLGHNVQTQERLSSYGSRGSLRIFGLLFGIRETETQKAVLTPRKVVTQSTVVL